VRGHAHQVDLARACLLLARARAGVAGQRFASKGDFATPDSDVLMTEGD
jgi:hypothetical protein